MVADLTRYSACTVHADAPDQPVPERQAPAITDALSGVKAEPQRDEPVRLFVWASA